MAAPATPMAVGGGVEMLRTQYLAGFKGSGYPTVPMSEDRADAAIDKSIDEIAAEHPELKPVLYNDVKVCPGCGKPCAFTLTVCNSCGRDLKDVALSQSENVFSAFLFGVRKAGKGFPYKISLRRLTENVLVIDDLLALSPCHLNGIPAKYYIPDWRFLLTAPKKALALLDTMEEELWQATKSFLDRSDFRKSIFRGSASDEDIRGKVIKSFNFPPSQYQMHIQWIVPPMMPFQHFMAETRNHFHEGRAFPMDYVRQVLQLNEPYPGLTQNTPIEDITAYYDARGVPYKELWTKFFEKALQDSMELQNWDAGQFEYVVEGGKAHAFSVGGGKVKVGKAAEGADPTAIQAKDKLALQNYGRPYDGDGKATGTYITRPLALSIGSGGYGEWPGVGLGGGPAVDGAASSKGEGCHCSIA